MPRRHHIFVSHATRTAADPREFVSTLVESLRGHGLSVFLDLDSFGSGLSILPSLEEVIENSDSALLVVTQRGNSSAWVGWERQRFRERQLAGPFPLIALLFDPAAAAVLPPALTWAAIIEADSMASVDRIARDIVRCLADLLHLQ